MKEKVEYTVVCISEFARKFKLTLQQAYQYLKQYQGISYLDEFYDVEHLFSDRLQAGELPLKFFQTTKLECATRSSDF